MEAFNSSYVVDLVKELLEKFKSLVIDEVGQAVNFDAEQELRKLQGKLLKAQVLLDSSQLTSNNTWLADLTMICYDAEDLVDDLTVGADRTSVIEKILSYFTRGTVGRKIQELQDRMEDTVKGLEMMVKIQQPSGQCSLGCLKDRFCQMQERLLPEKLFGRDEDKESIVRMLLKQSVCSVSIVGMGGLGKTMLARSVQNDGRIQANFNYIFWIPVSGKFDPIRISQLILHQRLECEPSRKKKRLGCENKFRATHLHDLFEGKSVLIVLDDLWDVVPDDWSVFCSGYFHYSGCKILLTTRNSNVALVTNTTPYYLHMMADEDCRALIMDRALSFNNLTERQHVILEGIAGEIAGKCKGLPVAASKLGHLLSSKRGEDDWVTLSQRDICDLPVFRNEIFPVFGLNNPDLASHLKKCLAYCSLFPHDYKFKREMLVQLWMAEGFILAPQGTTSLEEIGSDYFEELLMRSIFQFADIGEYAGHEKRTYVMHEFIHRFAESVAFDTCIRLEEDETCSSSWYKKVRHLSLLSLSIQETLKDVEKCEGLRTILLPSESKSKIGQVPYSFFQKLQRLRVLDLGNSDVVELPESMGGLKHLRYLDVSNTDIIKLPESTSNLQQLLVLKLTRCPKLLELPKDLKNLTNLLHLDVDTKKLRSMPVGIGCLSSLQTLPVFIVGKREGTRIGELMELRLLCGTLCLSNLQNIKDGTEAEEASLCEKASIKRLELIWSGRSKNGSVVKDVLAGLQPHENLKELRVTNYSGSSFPDWLTSHSCMLVNIHLQQCRQTDVLPSLGQLPFLKHLHIEGMHNVIIVDDKFCGDCSTRSFPSLKSLRVQDMKLLAAWSRLPEDSMLKLRRLKIEGCPSLVSMHTLNHMTSLQTLEINRCPGMTSLPELPPSLQSLIIVESGMPERYLSLNKLQSRVS